MRKIRFYTFFIILAIFVACSNSNSKTTEQKPLPEPEKLYQLDGTYRGVFIDKGEIQVSLQISFKNGIVQKANFRHLYGDENYNLKNEDEPYKSVINQYKETLEYLVGKDISTCLTDLYTPENIVKTEVDGYSGATIRSNKIIWAIRNAINNGMYSN